MSFTHLTPAPIYASPAGSSVRYHEAMAEDVLVRIRDYFVHVDIVVVDMGITKETSLILGWPFLLPELTLMLELEKSTST